MSIKKEYYKNNADKIKKYQKEYRNPQIFFLMC